MEASDDYATSDSGSSLIGALCAPAQAAETENLQLFRDVQKQVLRYAWFSIFDNVETQVNDGVVILHGKVTMPYKRNDIEKRVAKVDGVKQVINKIDVLPVSQFDDRLRHAAGAGHLRQPQLPAVCVDGESAHPHHRRARARHARRRGQQQRRPHDRQRRLPASFLAFEVKNELKTTPEAKAELEKL